MAVGMSAGGKHPKAIVAINWETGEVRSGQVALPEGFTYYILKFRDSESWPTAEIEYIYHKMALACGIDMEESRLLPAGGVNHFLTKRFDRNGGEKVHAATLYAFNGGQTTLVVAYLSVSEEQANRLFSTRRFSGCWAKDIPGMKSFT